MASLAAAHKGYLYQDIVTAYFLARSLVEPVQSTTVDAKFHSADRFDDLLSVGTDRTKIRRQFRPIAKFFCRYWLWVRQTERTVLGRESSRWMDSSSLSVNSSERFVIKPAR